MASESQLYNAYYAKLGRFYHAYTDLEHQLTCGVSLVVTEGRDFGKAYDAAIAVLGGMRMSPLKDTTKRLMRILETPQDRRDAMDKVFAHLGDIQFLRDRLAHHFTRPLSGHPHYWLNDDFAGIREFDKSKKLAFHVTALDAASIDLDTIKRLSDGIYHEYITPPMGVTFSQPFQPDQLPTWQYKPSMLSPRHHKNSDSPLPPPYQPPASAE